MLRRWMLVVAAALGLLVPAAGRCGSDLMVPSGAPGVTTVTAAEVKQLSSQGARIIDVRSIDDYFAARIPGASHVGYTEYSDRRPDFDPSRDDVDAFLARLRLFAKKENILVFYCNGIYCWKSYKAARVAVWDGYRAVHWFRGGLKEWVAEGMAVEKE